MAEFVMKDLVKQAGLDQEIQVALEKTQRLLDLTSTPRDIADPWYTGNFQVTYEDIREGCEKLLEVIRMAQVI